jgi:uncharacterized membrane protein YqjE
MADGGDNADKDRGTGLLASLQRLVGTALGIAQTRIEIVATEYEEERERLRELVFYGLASLWLFSFGLILLTLVMVMLFWEDHRLAVLSVFAGLYLVLGAGMGLVLRGKLKERPRLFAATVAELKKDRDRLSPDE